MNTATITALGVALKLAHPNDATLQRAVDRALENLPGAAYEFDGSELRVVSKSRRGAGCWQITDGTSCTCEAARYPHCWHRAAYALLLAEAVLINPLLLRAQIAEQTAPASVAYAPYQADYEYDEYGDVAPRRNLDGLWN